MKAWLVIFLGFCAVSYAVEQLPKLPCPYETEHSFCTDNSCPALHEDRASHKWWKIKRNPYYSFSVDNIEWFLVYPDGDELYHPKGMHVEVHAEPIVTKMKDGWYKITFNDEE